MSVEFNSLPVTVKPETDDSVSLSFDVPPDLREAYRHIPGQYLILRTDIDGVDVRRSYSICSSANSDELKVGIRRVPNGVFSTLATTELVTGDTLDVMVPSGEFVHRLEPDAANDYVAIAAGSGITPLLSIITSALETEQASRFTLVYGNKTAKSIMFLEEIEALKNQFCDRFSVLHVLSREPHDIPLFQGRIDAEKIRAIVSSLVDPAEIAKWYICGPLEMVEEIRSTLVSLGVDDDSILNELFFDQRIEPIPEPEADTEGLIEMVVTIDGRSSVVMVDPDGPPLLDYARTVRAEVPFACKGGMCATCKAQVTSGSATMDKNYALTDAEIEAGFILTCQAHPTSEAISVSFDVHGGAGR